MTIYSAAFAGVAVTAAQDVFELAASGANKFFALREIRLFQYSDAGDSAAELLSVQLIQGYTTTGSGGSAATEQALRRFSTAKPTAEVAVKMNNTTVAQDGTGNVLLADGFNIMGGWWYRPPEDERIVIDGALTTAARLVCRITAPADELSMNGTVIWEEGPGVLNAFG